MPDSDTPMSEHRSTRSTEDGWRQVQVGSHHSCGLRDEGIVCWGCEQVFEDSSWFTTESPCQGLPGAWTTFDSNDISYCALDGQGGVHCVDYTEPTVPLTSLDLNSNKACGLQQERGICWLGSGDDYPPIRPPETAFLDITPTCGVRVEDGRIDCWHLAPEPPDGAFTAIDSSSGVYCALRTDGEVVCWGWDLGEEPPPGPWTGFAVGVTHACAWNDHDFACWGDADNRPGQLPGTVVTADVLAGFGCAVLHTGHIACWGDDRSGAIYPP